MVSFLYLSFVYISIMMIREPMESGARIISFGKHKIINIFSRFEHNSLIVSYTKITNGSFGRQINITPGEERRTIWLHTPNRSKSSNGTK